MHCPCCRASYRDGFSECPDCHVALAPGDPLPIDMRALRAQAANLVRKYRDGEISNYQFEESFEPLWRLTADRAVKAIGTGIWNTYSDYREHKLADGRELPEALRSCLDRCVLFLESDLPYMWEQDNLAGIAYVTPLFRLLSRHAKRLLGRAPARFGLRSGPDSEQDWSVWPFQSEAELRARAPTTRSR